MRHPRHICLVRGNHECRSVSGHFGFKEECVRKYGLPVYYRFLLCFQTMPIGALVHTDYGTMLALHGGLSPKIARLEQLEELDRFVEPEEEQSLLEVLWSDPIQIREIRALIRDLAATGKQTVLLSTHILAEVEAICQRVVLIDRGQKVLDQSLAELTADGGSLEEVFTRVLTRDEADETGEAA